MFLTVLHRLLVSGSDRAADKWKADYALDGVHLYDPVSNQWSAGNSLATARESLTATLLPNGQPRMPGSLEAFGHAVEQQVTILSASDAFLILGALTVFLMVVVMTLPVRTFPPRIHFAKH